MRVLLLFLLSLFVLANEQNLYKLLEVSENATSQQIKKAFRKLSLKHHPDLNSDDENAQAKYLAIKRAYQVLIDVSTRNTYDLYGEAGLEQIKKNPKPKGGDFRPQMSVPLAKFYQGGDMVFSFRRGEICKKCKGSGDESGVIQDCPYCNGTGKMTRSARINGELRDLQMKCKECSGTGKGSAKKCPICKGERIVMKPRDLQFEVEKGMVDGDKVMFKGESQQGFDFFPGDVIVSLKQEPHSVFKRVKNDLKVSVPISLEEAILGFERNIKHLDNRNVQIFGDYNIQDEQQIRVQGEGMPVRGEADVYGDLIGKVRIKFPKSYTPQQLDQIRAIFNSSPTMNQL